eukprot:g2466.t1
MSTSSAQSDSRTRAYREYVSRLANDVGKKMELEYAEKVPESTARMEPLFGYRSGSTASASIFDGDAFASFYNEFMRRVQVLVFSERKAAIEGSLPKSIPEVLAAIIIDKYVGGQDVWPAEVLDIPAKIAQGLHDRQAEELGLRLEQEIMDAVRHVVELSAGVAGNTSLGETVTLSAALLNRSAGVDLPCHSRVVERMEPRVVTNNPDGSWSPEMKGDIEERSLRRKIWAWFGRALSCLAGCRQKKENGRCTAGLAAALREDRQRAVQAEIDGYVRKASYVETAIFGLKKAMVSATDTCSGPDR